MARPARAKVSDQEREVHRPTHLPFGSWCDHCAQGMATEDAHRAQHEQSEGLPRWSMEHVLEGRAAACSVMDAPTPLRVSSAGAGGIVRANFEVEQQCLALRSRLEEVFPGLVSGMGHAVMPRFIR